MPVSNDFNIKLWHGRSNYLMLTLQGHSNWVRCCVQVGPTLWSGGDDGSLRMWDAKEGTQTSELQVGDGAMSMALVGGHVWVGFRDMVIRVYNAEVRKRI